MRKLILLVGAVLALAGCGSGGGGGEIPFDWDAHRAGIWKGTWSNTTTAGTSVPYSGEVVLEYSNSTGYYRLTGEMTDSATGKRWTLLFSGIDRITDDTGQFLNVDASRSFRFTSPAMVDEYLTIHVQNTYDFPNIGLARGTIDYRLEKVPTP